MAESNDNSTELHIAFMDTSKAFDVVHHNGLLNSIYEQGVSGGLWNLYNNPYQEIQSVVLWKGHQSTFKKEQGIRQGGTTSADLYKAGKNKLLEILNDTTDCRVGHINAGALMVADDLVIAANSPSDLQHGVSIAALDSQHQRYSFNVNKTKIVSLNSKNDPSCLLSKEPIAMSTCETHLSISRNNKNTNKDTINARIINARRAMYSLMGAGLHGLNGVGPEVAIVQYNTYVLPTLLYGLEALHLIYKDIEELSKFHRMNLRCIQHLPRSTAIPAIHLLSGPPPPNKSTNTHENPNHLQRYRSNRNTTSFLPEANSHAAIGDEGQHVSQLDSSAKEDPSKIWATVSRRDLGDTAKETILGQLVKDVILRHWTDKIQDAAQQMSTLAHLKLDASDLGKLHSTWLELHNKLDIRKASVKAQLLVQRYPLSGNHTAGETKSTQCILCHQCEGTTAHFLLHCSALYQARHLYLPRILDSLRRYRISVDPPNLVHILHDTNHLPSDVSSNDRAAHETLSRDLLFKLHVHSTRSILLGGTSAYQRALQL